MKKIISFLLIISIFSCSKTEDDTDINCTSDCTTLQGRFITLDNQGIKGVKISINYRIPGGELGGGYTRKIAEVKTDQYGNFYKEFYIKDSELGDSTNGYFKVEIDNSMLDVNKYILSDNKIGSTSQPLGYAIYSINNRDTIIGNTYYLPKKTHIKVNLNNYIPILTDDYFEVRTLYPFGPNIGENNVLDSSFATGFSGWGTFLANNSNTQLNPFVAENEQNIIQIIRRKNGVNSTEEFPMFIPSNNSIELNFEY